MKVLRNVFFVSILFQQEVISVIGQHPNPETFTGPNGTVPLSTVRGDTDGNPYDDTCGLTCRAPDQYAFGLYACLDQYYRDADPVELYEGLTISKVVYSPATSYEEFDSDMLAEYNIARHGAVASRLPAAVLFAENEDDVKKGVNCARVNGYKVAPRGRGHDYAGTATTDGALVIDMQLTCKFDDIEFESVSDGGQHIVEGSEIIAKMTVPAGCTNAVVLAALENSQFSEDGLTLIGSCPSVGVVGFFLHGGLGDFSPYLGTGSDLIDEIHMINWAGDAITLSVTENEEIFWAVKGGTGGFGVVTKFVERVIKNPSESKKVVNLSSNGGSDSGGLWFKPAYVSGTGYSSNEELDEQVEIMMRLQNFFYNDANSTLYGGSLSNIVTPDFAFVASGGNFLGNVSELVDVLSAAGLLNVTKLSSLFPSLVSSNGVVQCNNGASDPCEDEYDNYPPYGLRVREANTQAQAQLRQICSYVAHQDTSQEPSIFSLVITARSLNICSDLDIPLGNTTHDGIEICVQGKIQGVEIEGLWDINPLACDDDYVVNQFYKAAKKPQSFINRHGPAKEVIESLNSLSKPSTFNFYAGFGRGTGGLMIPQLQQETYKNLLKDLEVRGGFNVNHLSHGAPLMVPFGKDGYPHRNAAYNMAVEPRSAAFLERLLQDPVYEDPVSGDPDPNNLQIYGNYNPAMRTFNYETLVYGDNAEKLSEYRTRHDPMGMFDNEKVVQRNRHSISRSVPAILCQYRWKCKCKDDPKSFKVGRKMRKCKYAQGKNNKQQIKRCGKSLANTNGKLVSDVCPVTCGLCDPVACACDIDI